MQKSIADLINELNIPDEKTINLYDVLEGSGIRKKHWVEIENYLIKDMKKWQGSEFSEHATSLFLMILARGYDAGLKARGF